MPAVIDDILFRPFNSPKLTLPGRVMMAPMTRLQCPGGVPGQKVKDFYLRRAKNGVGFMMSEGITIDHPTASPNLNAPSLSSEAAREGWSGITKALHEEGTKIGCQLWHAGTIRNKDEAPFPDFENHTPSHLSGFQGHMITDEVAQDIASAYARTARYAVDAGFDAIEVHCAHGYLLDLFMWEKTNQLTGKWGGNTPFERAQYPIEIVKQVRAEIGDEVPILARFSQWKTQNFGTHLLWKTPFDLEPVMLGFAEAGVDIFDCSLRRFWEPEFEGSKLNLAGWVKQITNRPTIAVGSVGLRGDFLTAFMRLGADSRTELEKLRACLEADEFDLIAVGRALMNDPAWLNKVREGDEDSFVAMPKSVMDTYH